jgi:hypothetical protein
MDVAPLLGHWIWLSSFPVQNFIALILHMYFLKGRSLIIVNLFLKILLRRLHILITYLIIFINNYYF